MKNTVFYALNHQIFTPPVCAMSENSEIVELDKICTERAAEISRLYGEVERLKSACAEKVKVLVGALESVKEVEQMNYILDDPENDTGIAWCSVCDGQVPHGHSENCPQGIIDKALETAKELGL